jgi:HAMP domain-containing protein
MGATIFNTCFALVLGLIVLAVLGAVVWVLIAGALIALDEVTHRIRKVRRG